MAKKKTTKKATRATKGVYVDKDKKKPAKKKAVKKPSKSAKRATTAKAVKPTGVLKKRSKAKPVEAPVAEVMSSEDLFSDDEDTMQADDFDTLNHEDEADADLEDF